MHTFSARRRADECGFSLVELSLVIAIIAVLTAIAIPTFFGARDRAQDRAAEQNVRNALTAVRVSGSDAGGYKTLAFADLPLDEPQLSWVEGDTVSAAQDEMSVTINNGDEVVTVAARHESGDCYFLRDWFNEATGVEYSVVAASAGVACKADNGSDGAVAWGDSW